MTPQDILKSLLGAVKTVFMVSLKFPFGEEGLLKCKH
jgi:hypothetical protein